MGSERDIKYSHEALLIWESILQSQEFGEGHGYKPFTRDQVQMFVTLIARGIYDATQDQHAEQVMSRIEALEEELADSHETLRIVGDMAAAFGEGQSRELQRLEALELQVETILNRQTAIALELAKIQAG